MKNRPILIASLLFAMIFAFALVFVSYATPALADGSGYGDRAKKHEEHFQQLLQKLNLAPEQSERINGIIKSFRDGSGGQKDQIRGEWKKLHELARRDDASEDEIRAQLRKMASLKEDMFIQRVQMIRQIRASLTPEQNSQWEAMKQEHFQKHGEHHGGHSDLDRPEKK